MILHRLKHETQDVHARLEQRLDLLGGHWSRARYEELLRRFRCFYVPVEAAIWNRAEWRTPALHGFDIEARRKLPLLRRDLEFFGLSEAALAALPLCRRLPDLSDFAQVLGGLYVLEGATLGGQILARHFRATLGLEREAGCAFFSSYGEAVGDKWKSFRAMLCAQTASRQAGAANGTEDSAIEDTMIAAARATFCALEAWLCAEVAPHEVASPAPALAAPILSSPALAAPDFSSKEAP